MTTDNKNDFDKSESRGTPYNPNRDSDSDNSQDTLAEIHKFISKIEEITGSNKNDNDSYETELHNFHNSVEETPEQNSSGENMNIKSDTSTYDNAGKSLEAYGLDEEKTKKLRVKQSKERITNFLAVIIPITVILTIMLVGQAYINRKSDGKIKILTIETIPRTEENGTTVTIININTASAVDLTFLPGIGEVKAKSIVEYRERHGEFSSVEDIMKVKGIGESTFEKIKPYITV